MSDPVTTPPPTEQGLTEDDGPECELCGKTDCPDANLVEFSEPVACAYRPVYEALRYDRCEYGCGRDVTMATIRRDVIPALAPLVAEEVAAAEARALREAAVSVLDAIKAVRTEAADERTAAYASGEPLTDYGSGVLDGLDRAWLAGTKAARRPTDQREVTSIEEWWACDDAYVAGIRDAAALAEQAVLEWENCGCRPVCWHKVAAKELRALLARADRLAAHTDGGSDV